jgi:hypothetical protein
MTVAKEPDHRGEHEGNRKTIARGMPGVFRCDLTNACAFTYDLRTRSGGRIGRPAFPAPSVSDGRKFMQTSGASRRERAKVCRLLRHCERSEAIHRAEQ